METEEVAGENPSSTHESGRKRRLVVLAPGFWGNLAFWKPLRKELERDRDKGYREEEAEWLEFDHHSNPRNRGTIDALARELVCMVDGKWLKNGGYDEVVLVGHSMGGLIVRQAYLLAAGAVRGSDASEWSRYVIRIVLLASINRGVDMRRLPLWRPLVWLTKIVPFAPHLLLHDALRGSGFLSNLRINWIRHFGGLAEKQSREETWPDGRLIRPPLVAQLLGSQDRVLTEDDSKDIFAFPGGHYRGVPGTDHSTVYRLDKTPNPDLQYAVLRDGFIGDFADASPEERAVASANEREAEVERVVFLLHGIRASNVDSWIKQLEQLIKSKDPHHTVVRHPTYGYFSAARFALPTVRRRNTAVFLDWYTEALAMHPTARFSIIAHSNGTYMLGRSLFNTPGMRFENVVLAGSVLPEDYWQRWSQGDRPLSEQVKRMRNDRAARDWPVALLCSALNGLYMCDVGRGGFAGFDGEVAFEAAYYKGGHGEALKPDNQSRLVDFVFDLPATKPEALPDSPGPWRQLSNFMPYFAKFVAVSLLIGFAYFVYLTGAVGAAVAAVAIIFFYIVIDII